MSRPSSNQSRDLELLEGASGKLAQALRDAGILAIRLRQIGRRAPELAEWVQLAQCQLGQLVDNCDGARANLLEALDGRQAKRQADNAKRDTG